jgi:hypothetical protein
MKKLLVSVLFMHLLNAAWTQSFEGIVKYKVDITSKDKSSSEDFFRTILALGTEATSYVKPGLARESNGASDYWFVSEKKKVYVKFKGIDTLYEMDYAEDTTVALKLGKTGEKQTIAGYDCEVFEVQTHGKTEKHFFAPALYVDPSFDADCKLGHYGELIKAASSQWLAYSSETEAYKVQKTATSVEKRTVPADLIALPALPVVHFEYERLLTPPQYSGKEGWQKYIVTNLNADLASKYVKLKKGEQMAEDKVIVTFRVSERGEITDVKAKNPKEVHPRLREEAERLISESRRWKPATIYGIPIAQYMEQPIVFRVQR